MDFDLSSEQSQLKESVDRLIGGIYVSLDARRAQGASAVGFSAGTWVQFAELGLLGIPFSEEEGGYGGGPVGISLVMEAIGRNLALEPYFATVVLGGSALRFGASPAQKERLIPAIVDGSLRLALATTERQSRYDLVDVATTATRTAAGYVLNGAKCVVINGDSAGSLIVSARTSGERRDPAGISLFLVAADALGVTIRGSAAQDGGRVAEVDLAGVLVAADDRIGTEGAGLATLERVQEHAIAALAAEAVGVVETLHGLTLDYLRTRKQFGAPISSFQVLQHRAVDMFIELEQARSMAFYAAMMVEAEDADERRIALGSVKVQINKACRLVGQEAVQLHGGIGMTMEYMGAHCFKRLTMIENLFGDTAHHLRRVAAKGGL
jgi:pimeloyl-CoA dehydrogenase small subunit